MFWPGVPGGLGSAMAAVALRALLMGVGWGWITIRCRVGGEVVGVSWVVGVWVGWVEDAGLALATGPPRSSTVGGDGEYGVLVLQEAVVRSKECAGLVLILVTITSCHQFFIVPRLGVVDHHCCRCAVSRQSR